MPRGSAPGERRGGRKKGVPNKTTLARSARIVEQRQAAGLKLGKDLMSEAANYFRGLADRYAPTGAQPNDEKFERYLYKAAMIAARVAPYESPTLQSITVRQQPWDLTRLSEDELAIFERLAEKASVAGGDQGREGATLQ